ncbi:MAG: murein biosynthesis integral membrane protein MurJ, partial [Spirochaetes bacterium]
MNNRHIAKSAFYMSMVTFTSRLFGLAREWLRGYLLGTTSGSDAFTIAFMFPNLLRRLVGEGALTAAFIPVFSDYLSKGNKDELDEFVKSFFTVLLLFLIVLVALVLFFA